ncbi:MAG: DUF3997 domain-containing protein [Bacteroidales bacterium]
MKTILISILILFAGCYHPLPVIDGKYDLVYNGVNDTGLVNTETDIYIVYGNIVEFAYDSTYIVLAEKPRDSVPEAFGLPLPEKNKIFYASKFRQYYIFNKTTEKRYGPFNRIEFDNAIQELNIPDNLILK